jgi:hypothetical protein
MSDRTGAVRSTGSTPLSLADQAAHDAGTHYRLPKRVPGAVLKADQVEDAYQERARQFRAEVTAERAMAGAL